MRLLRAKQAPLTDTGERGKLRIPRKSKILQILVDIGETTDHHSNAFGLFSVPAPPLRCFPAKIGGVFSFPLQLACPLSTFRPALGCLARGGALEGHSTGKEASG